MAEDNPLTDRVIALMGAYFPALVILARQQGVISYSGLRNQCATIDKHLPKAVDQEVGQIIEWFRLFTDPRHLPDICALVINKNTNEPGDGYDRDFFE